MRIAQLTLNTYENYGNMLQKFALYYTLKKFADFVEVIWHCQTTNFPPAELEFNRLRVDNVRNIAFRCVKENKCKEFSDANIRTRFDVPYIEDIGDEYDFFVVGSDQVWNPRFEFPSRFLEFAPREKRISYAASIAVADLPDNVREYYRRGISEMAHVSIREQEGCDLVEKITGKRPIQVLDPVFLMTAKEWRKFSRRPTWLNQDRYLLTYFFSGNPPASVRTLAARLNLPLINLFDMNNFNHYSTSPDEFLYLIDHAALICTESFHGTAFSTIFKRPFVLCSGSNKQSIKIFSRINSLLTLFNLTERAFSENAPIGIVEPFEINYTRRDEILPVECAKAFNFLSEALGVEMREEILGEST